MKILILVALILQVIIVQETDGYNFGDIIEFPRTCGPITYKHYAIYVGPQSGVNVGQGDNDIFHRTRETGPNGLYCGFAKLEKTRLNSQDTEANYLEEPGLIPEEVFDFAAALRGKHNIICRIKELQDEENCGKYNLLSKNCEHLATYVITWRSLG
uniref:LRAT domain-containing protein n=1 Tax=Larimichthys crocea TaxID=215358 RepID=A0A0F8CE50_LARCR